MGVKAVSLQSVLGTLRRIGPYVLIEVLLPGGTLLALLLWLSSGASRGQFSDVQQVAPQPVAVARMLDSSTQKRYRESGHSKDDSEAQPWNIEQRRSTPG